MRKIRRGIGGAATALIGLGVSLAGLLPPHALETGQIDPRAWCWPLFWGSLILLTVLRWSLERWRWRVVVLAMLALILPPLALCLAASEGQADRLGAWLHPVEEVPREPVPSRPLVGVLSGPVLHGPASGDTMAGFAVSPLWEIVGRAVRPVPFAMLDGDALGRVSALLLVQPRALAPGELVALDDWIRAGGRAVLLVDPDLRWADARPLGHPLRPPPVSLLDPLLDHWGLTLAPAPARSGGDPVERRFLADGRMIQIAGASHFLPTRALPDGGRHCQLSSGGLVARCGLGKGVAILVADADFANDALWTVDPARPARTAAWTSDAAPVLLDWLAPGAGEAAGRRVWLTHAHGLPMALRRALLILSLILLGILFVMGRNRTKQEL